MKIEEDLTFKPKQTILVDYFTKTLDAINENTEAVIESLNYFQEFHSGSKKEMGLLAEQIPKLNNLFEETLKLEKKLYSEEEETV